MRANTVPRPFPFEKAGIDAAGRPQLQFYPQHVTAALARLEREHTKAGRVDKLRETVFGVRRSGGGYECLILEQQQPCSQRPGE